MPVPVQTDVVIVGAGPVGLFAVFACGMVGLRAHVVDSLEHIGGQCSALYPEKPIYDIPGHPCISGGDLIAALERQAAPFSPVFHLGEQVTGLSRCPLGWAVRTGRHRVLEGRAVLIAGGAGSFGPQKPPLEGIEGYEGRSVFYSIRSATPFRDKRIVIAGGGDSAVDWAISLERVAARVSLVHRRDKFRASPAMVGKLHGLAAADHLDLFIPYQVSALQGQDGQLTGVTLADLDGNEKSIAADIFLPFFGLSTTLGPLADWGLALERNQIVADPVTGATSLPGVYAVGDIAAYPQKLKLILTGFSEATQAAHAIYRQINPGRERHFEYSTTSGIPGAAPAGGQE